MAANVLEREFDADGPNQKWVADFTYIWTAEGWLYVAAVIDLFSRRVVGWSMSDQMTSQMVTDALIMGECPIFCVTGRRSMLRRKDSVDHGKEDQRRRFGRTAEGLRAA